MTGLVSLRTAGLLLLGTLLAAGLWWWLPPAAPVLVPAVAAVPAPAPALPSPFGSGPVVAGPDAPPPAAPAAAPVVQTAPPTEPTTAMPQPAAGELAPGLSLAELQELKAQLDGSANPNDEAGRMAQEMLFNDAALRLAWLLRSGGAPAAELHGLAKLVDQALDAQLARGHVTPAQALQHKAAVLQATVADAAQRQQLLQQWHLAKVPAQPR